MLRTKLFARTTIGALALLVSVMIILYMTPKATGQYEIGGHYITIDPKARGTLLKITLAVHYVYIPQSVSSPCQKNKTVLVPQDYWEHGLAAGPFFMRVQLGSTFHAYSGNFSDTSVATDTLSKALCTGDFTTVNFIPWDGIADQERILNDFLKARVIPELFPGNPTAPFVIKSQTEPVTGGAPEESFAMFDVTLAVQG